jgi:phosphoribosylanthranilate isomerase
MSGLSSFAKSPRYVEPAEAGRLREAAARQGQGGCRHRRCRRCLLDEIVAAAPDMLQLHGKETPERVAEVKHRYGLPVMKALPLARRRSRGDRTRYRHSRPVLVRRQAAQRLELPGGNGVAFDWRILASLDASVDYMLSGGFNAANIGDALARECARHRHFQTQFLPFRTRRGWPFGIFGGRFVAETLMPLILDLQADGTRPRTIRNSRRN